MLVNIVIPIVGMVLDIVLLLLTLKTTRDYTTPRRRNLGKLTFVERLLREGGCILTYSI